MLPSRATITLAAVLTLLVVFAALALALSMPRLDLTLAPASGEGPGLLVADVDETGPNAGRLADGDRIVAFLLPDERIEADESLLVEEPDTLPDYVQYNAFLVAQGALARGLRNGTLSVELSDGRRVMLATREAETGDLPALFWFQLFVGAAGVLTGAIVLALGEKKNRATRLYALTGFGYLIFAPAAAVYSTRELALDASVFRALSVANHFGALFFTASLTALLWHYPRRLSARFPMAAVTYLTALAVWLVDTFQLAPTPLPFHLGVLGIFLVSFVFAAGQWVRTRGLPADRAALRWFLLSIYVATGLFAGTVIVPAAFNLPLLAPQGVMFGAFLIMYWGLALGVVRYRLFALEEWWYSIWIWFLSGVAVVLLDILLVVLIELDAGIALSLSVGVVGWLYFPVRQRVWEKLGRSRGAQLQDWLPAVLPLVIQMPDGHEPERRLHERWPKLLSTVFAPLSLGEEPQAVGLSSPRIVDEGLALRVPNVMPDAAPIVLRHADGGRRLFTRRDLDTLSSLRRLFDLALGLLRAHEVGASAERTRIARDIHDDLGAKLLNLLYSVREDEQPMVRDAIACARELNSTLNHKPISLEFAIAQWRTELHERMEPTGIALSWTVDGDAENLSLSARQNANLTRLIRESVTNAIKHAAPARIEIALEVTSTSLRLQVKDDGGGLPEGKLDANSGGLAIMRTRAKELDATVLWRSVSGEATRGCEVVVEMPLG